MKYLQLLNAASAQTDAELAKEQNAFTAEDANLKLQGSILQLKRDVSAITQEIKALKQSTTFNPGAIYAAENKAALKRRELKFMNKLHKEMF